MNPYSPEVVSAVQELLEIGIALSAEKNHKKLLERILSEARRITRCDAGTLYLVEGGKLSFQIIQNDQLKIYQGGLGEPINLPPVEITETSVAGYCALHKKVINIPDVYNTQLTGFDFSGPRRYDAITGYRTSSMLVAPLEDHNGDITGVLQLLNAKDEEGTVIPFAGYIEQVVLAVASQAAVAISNMRYLEEIDAMLHSFVRVISTAIDERSPYNANHTRNIARLSGKFARYLKGREIGQAADLTDEDIDQLIMSAWLHDIGKIAVPLEIMDKPSRLGERYEMVRNRLLAIREQRKVDAIKAAMKHGEQLKTEAGITAFWREVSAIEEEMDNAAGLLATANNPACFVDPQIQALIQELAGRTWLTPAGTREAWLSPSEVEALMVPRGTLTDQERQIMENHVLITKKMLDQIPFGEKYSAVPGWACAHHEFLDGSGYPQKLKSVQLPLPVRILTIMDIFDALTAQDRPYKKALPAEKAFSIIEEMAKVGKLDGELVGLFKESQVWDTDNKSNE